MRDYQRTKKTKYILPKAVYHMTLWRIRDYYRLKEMANYLIYAKSEGNEIYTKNTYKSDKVLSAVIKREKILSELESIENALSEIPKEYQQGVWSNIQYGQAYPLDAGRATYGRYKSKFIYKLAEKFNLI